MRRNDKLTITRVSSIRISEEDEIIYKRFGNAFTISGVIHDSVNVTTIFFHSSDELTVDDIPLAEGIRLNNVTLTEVS